VTGLDDDEVAFDPLPRLLARAGDEPIAGYRLLELLGTGGFGEVWKCEVPGRLFKALKIIRGDGDPFDDGSSRAAVELEAVERIKSIRHPFLLSIDRIEVREQELLIVTELADRSLHDLRTQRQAEGLPGIPRAELLPLLLEAAEALDVINFEHGLQHLDVKPGNLLLVGNHIKVADFGLVYSLKELAGDQPLPRCCAVTPRYASPEALQGGLSSRSDQYSLAIVYQELLTGTLPFQGKSIRHEMILHLSSEPELEALPEADRPAIACALSRNAEQRFASCQDLVRALIENDASRAEPPRRTGTSSLGQTPLPRSRLNKVAALPAPAPVAPSAESPSSGLPSLAEYQVLEVLSQGPLGEVRRIQTPEGRRRLARFLPRLDAENAPTEEDLVARLTTLQHPALPETELHRGPGGEIILLTDVQAPTLRERFQECTARGLPGIPRAELLDYLRAAAVSLDALHARHGLQHLGLNPRTLLVRDGRVWLADFGLIQLLWLPRGYSAAPLNGRFSDPRFDQHGVYRAADVYSLALIYVEMLLGMSPRPIRGRSGRHRRTPKLDLSFLSTRDHEVIARATHDDPGQRFRTCAELIAALEGTAEPAVSPAPQARPCLPCHPPLLPIAVLKGQTVAAEAAVPALNVILAELLATRETVPTCVAGRPDCLERSSLLDTLPAEMVRLKLHVFRQQWGAVRVCREQTGYTFRVQGPQSLWQRCLGQESGLLVSIHLEPLGRRSSRLSRATVRVEAASPGAHNRKQLHELGPALLDSALSLLQARPDLRAYQRQPFAEPVRVYPVWPNHELGTAVEGQGRDISRTGIGLLLPQRPEAERLYIHLYTTDSLASLALLTQVVWSRSRTDGRVEVGTALVTAEPATQASQSVAVA
jgi:serine/threonine protein kinase